MKKGWIALIAVVAAVLILYGWAKGTYNGMVQAQEQVGQAWSNVESTYQRRADLIPNLVETVKGYASHEQEVLTGVTEARSRAGQISLQAENLDAQTMERFREAQQNLSGALSRLLAVSERYPDLKANQNFLDLQTQLEGTENRINVARARYNEAARAYNTRVRSFPANLFAQSFGFEPRPYYEADEGAAKAPQVKF